MLLGTNSNLFFNNSIPLPLQFNCFYFPKTELHFIFSPYKTDKRVILQYKLQCFRFSIAVFLHSIFYAFSI